MPITTEQLNNWFTYHAPTPGPYKSLPLNDGGEHHATQAEVYELIRAAGLQFATVIVGLTPPSADQTAAVRKIREAVFTANAAIACDGK